MLLQNHTSMNVNIEIYTQTDEEIFRYHADFIMKDSVPPKILPTRVLRSAVVEAGPMPQAIFCCLDGLWGNCWLFFDTSRDIAARRLEQWVWNDRSVWLLLLIGAGPV
jgi:hypothetical protein